MDRSQIPLTLPLLLAAAVAIAADSKPPSTEDAQVAHLKDAKWAAPKLKEIPPGVMSSPIAGDPTSGGSVGYAKYTPGYVFPMHWHSATEYTTILAGKTRIVMDGKPYDLEPGSYIVIPGKTHHQFTCLAGAECVVMTRRGGPTDYHFVEK
jgi:quercetin dioxygenase-like cupin family protein